MITSGMSLFIDLISMNRTEVVYVRIRSDKTYKYEDTKPLPDQLPVVKTVKPEVKITMMQKTRAAGVE